MYKTFTYLQTFSYILYLINQNKNYFFIISSKFIKCSNNYNGLEISAMNKKLYFSNSHSKMLLEVTFNYKLKFDCPKKTDFLYGIRKKSTFKWKYFLFLALVTAVLFGCFVVELQTIKYIYFPNAVCVSYTTLKILSLKSPYKKKSLSRSIIETFKHVQLKSRSTQCVSPEIIHVIFQPRVEPHGSE